MLRIFITNSMRKTATGSSALSTFIEHSMIKVATEAYRETVNRCFGPRNQRTNAQDEENLAETENSDTDYNILGNLRNHPNVSTAAKKKIDNYKTEVDGYRAAAAELKDTPWGTLETYAEKQLNKLAPPSSYPRFNHNNNKFHMTNSEPTKNNHVCGKIQIEPGERHAELANLKAKRRGHTGTYFCQGCSHEAKKLVAHTTSHPDHSYDNEYHSYHESLRAMEHKRSKPHPDWVVNKLPSLRAKSGWGHV